MLSPQNFNPVQNESDFRENMPDNTVSSNKSTVGFLRLSSLFTHLVG